MGAAGCFYTVTFIPNYLFTCLYYSTKTTLIIRVTVHSRVCSFNLTNRFWDQFWRRRDVMSHLYYGYAWWYLGNSWYMNFSFATLYVVEHFKACALVRNYSRTNVGVKIDPRICLTFLFLGLFLHSNWEYAYHYHFIIYINKAMCLPHVSTVEPW